VNYGEYAPFDVNDSDKSAEFLVYKRPERSNEEEVRAASSARLRP